MNEYSKCAFKRLLFLLFGFLNSLCYKGNEASDKAAIISKYHSKVFKMTKLG